MADPVVTITNGIPTSGTGTITTLGAVVEKLPAALAANGGLKVEGVASGTPIPVSNSGTFAVQAAATLAAETTKVIGTVNVAASQTIAATNAGTFATQESGAALTALQLIDDTVAAQAASLGTTKNTLIGGSVTTSAPTYTTGTINPLSLDTTGALRVTSTGGSSGTQYTEDVAAATDPIGNMLIAVRKDTLSTSEVSADGDNIALKATNKGKLHVAAEVRLGDTAADVGSGAIGSATQRVAIASDSPGVIAVGTAGTAATNVLSVQGIASMTPVTVSITDISNGEYWAVGSGATATVLGTTGATGDYISGVLVTPTTVNPGNVILLDNATSMTVFAGGTASVSNLVPFFIPLGAKSKSGAWKVTTGSSVTVIGIGNFT